MAISEFLAFATNAAANVMPQTQWEANPAVINGFAAGIARSREANKAWRQGSFVGAALAHLIPDILNEDALDNGDRPRMTDQLRRVIGAIAQSVSLSDSAQDGLTYGRRNGAWVRVPSWEDFFADAAADNATYGRRNNAWVRVLSWDEAWGNFLPLSGGQMTGFIRLHDWPQDPMHAVPMSWVEAYVSGRVGAYLPLTGGTLSGPGNVDMYGNLNVIGSFVAYPYNHVYVSNNLNVGSNLYAGRYSRNDGGPGTINTHGNQGITFNWNGTSVEFFIDGTYVGNNTPTPPGSIDWYWDNPGNYAIGVPVGASRMMVWVWGGGGGGSGSNNNTATPETIGASGGGGGFCGSTINVQPGWTVNIQVGGGGYAAINGGQAGDGGTSACSGPGFSLIAYGGGGGAAGAPPGGGASGGVMNISGQAGTDLDGLVQAAIGGSAGGGGGLGGAWSGAAGNHPPTRPGGGGGAHTMHPLGQDGAAGGVRLMFF